MRTWKPGDVALIEVGCWANRHVALFGKNGTHPLVVIDPEDREQIERLARAAHNNDHIADWSDLHKETRAQLTDDLQATLRSLIEPPKPEEPTGLGAVVEDAEGDLWTRVTIKGASDCWQPNNRREDALRRPYVDIAVTKVLSEGIKP